MYPLKPIGCILILCCFINGNTFIKRNIYRRKMYKVNPVSLTNIRVLLTTFHCFCYKDLKCALPSNYLYTKCIVIDSGTYNMCFVSINQQRQPINALPALGVLKSFDKQLKYNECRKSRKNLKYSVKYICLKHNL